MGEGEIEAMATPRWLTKDREQTEDAVFGLLFGSPTLFPEVSGVSVGGSRSFAQLPNVLTTVVLNTGQVGSIEYIPQAEISRSVIYQRFAQAYKCAVEDMLFAELRTTEMVSELRRKVKDFAKLLPDWDSEGAEAISVETVNTALQVIEHIAIVLERKNTVSAPLVRPFPDGSIFFKWIRGQKELAVTVHGARVEAQRWEPLSAFQSQGLWEIPVGATPEHVDWVLT